MGTCNWSDLFELTHKLEKEHKEEKINKNKIVEDEYSSNKITDSIISVATVTNIL